MSIPHLASSGDIAVLFPGQGSQRVGMGTWLFREVPQMRETLDAVSAFAGCDIAKLCARGPMSLLSDTRYTQPAMFAVGIAAFRYLACLGTPATVLAGHSVGEITAMCASGALSADRAAALVCERGRLMASAPGTGQMALITGLGRDIVQRCCDDCAAAGRVVIAAQNGQDEHVVSGDEQAVMMCCDLAVSFGARRAGRLRTSHAFHSPLMQPVLASWQSVVNQLGLEPASIPVILNVTAEIATDPQRLRSGLLHQLTRPVEWWSTMRTLVKLGVRKAVVCEAGNYLSLLARNAGLYPLSFANPGHIRELQHASRAGVRWPVAT